MSKSKGKIIQFHTREELNKKRREKVWQEWLEWERWEEENAKYHENKETDEALNFDDPDNVDNHFISDEDLEVLEQEERYARKEMMRNKKEENHKTLNLSPEEWTWLEDWMKSMKK